MLQSKLPSFQASKPLISVLGTLASARSSRDDPIHVGSNTPYQHKYKNQSRRFLSFGRVT